MENPLAASGGGGGAPGGSTGDIQFNNGGAFANAAAILAGSIARIAGGFMEFLCPGGMVVATVANMQISALLGLQLNGSFGSGDTIIGNSDNFVTLHGTPLSMPDLPVFTDNAAALLGGLVATNLYRTGSDPDTVCVVH